MKESYITDLKDRSDNFKRVYSDMEKRVEELASLLNKGTLSAEEDDKVHQLKTVLSMYNSILNQIISAEGLGYE